MQIYSIKKALNITGYKIVKIISENDKEVHLRVEPHKRKEFICSGCGQVHKIGYHGIEETVAEDLGIFGKRVYLHVIKRRHNCPTNNRTHLDRYYAGIGEYNCKRIESVVL